MERDDYPEIVADEPTITDIARTLDVVAQEIRILGLEFRAGIAEVKGGVAGLRLEMQARFSEVYTRLDTLFEEVASFRAEYNQHTHPDD